MCVSYLLSVLKKHWPAVLLALVIGAFTSFPQLVAEYWMGDVYQGVHPVISDDELFYMAREREVLDGHALLGSPYLAEYKDLPSLEFWIPDAFVAGIGYLLGDLHRAVILLDFMLPILLVLITYAIAFSLTKDRLLSASSTTFLYLGLFFEYFNRMPNPQLTYSLFLLFILALIRVLATRSWQWAVIASVSFTALFYSYTFSWTFAVVILAVLAFLFFILLRGEKLHYWFAGIGAIGIVGAIPYFITLFLASKTPYYHEALLRIGLLETHFPSGMSLLLLVGFTVAVYIVLWRMGIVPVAPLPLLLVGMSIAGATVMNQHVITGKNFQFAGHYTMPGAFLCVFALLYAFKAFLLSLENRKMTLAHAVKKGMASILLVLSFVAVTPVVFAMATPTEETIFNQRYGPVLTWLDVHSVPDEVVFANQTLSQLVPVYTHNNVFFSTWAQVAYLSNEQVRARYIRARYFDTTLTREDIMRTELDLYGASYMGERQHLTQQNKLRALFGMELLPVKDYPEEDLLRVISEWEKLRTQPFAEVSDSYRLEYLVWDTEKDASWNLSALKEAEEVFRAGAVRVYKITPR